MGALQAYGRALVPGLSPVPGVTAGLRGQVGVGSQADNASSRAQWGWREASFNVDLADAGGAEEFQASFVPAYSGTRAVSLRFSLDDGGSWSYCDTNGSEVNCYEVGQQWALSVGNASGIDYCALKFPSAVTQTADAGTLVYGQLYVAGVTEAPGADPSVFAELGYGPKLEDPGTSSRWVWQGAAYKQTCASCGANNDEYQAALSAQVGAWSYAFRFSRDGGTGACYGDLDGTGTSAGFNGEAGTSDNLGSATVSP